MLDIVPAHLVVVAIVAMVVIGPKDLPRVMRVVGQWTGKARAMARHFRSGIDAMIREAELEEMEKKWKEENERIMREFPAADGAIAPASVDGPSKGGAAAASADEPQLPLPVPDDGKPGSSAGGLP